MIYCPICDINSEVPLRIFQNYNNEEINNKTILIEKLNMFY